MTIFEKINWISIIEILNRVWIKYKKVMGTLNLYDKWKVSDWWKANINDNFVTDFAWKWRAQWDQLSFIQWLMNSGKWEAVEWFKNNFGLIDEENYKMEYKKEPEIIYKKIDIKTKFNNLKELWINQIEYLKTRWIDYEKIKDVVKENRGWITCMIYNEKWQIISLNTRSITEKRFYIEAWTNSKGVYMWNIDKEDKKIYVVEWMFDFLSLRQYKKNIIGLKSVNDWIEVIKEFYNKWYEINLIPDNDEAWKNILEKFNDIKYNIFNLEKYWIKDINDFLLESWYWEGIFEIIDEEKTKWGFIDEFEIIDYEETLKTWIEELNKTDPKQAISWGYESLDNKIWYILPWQLILVWWTTWTWKSTFVWEIAKNISKQGNKVLKFTLEDRLEDKKKQELFYEVWRIRTKNWLKNYPYNDFMVNNIHSDSYTQEIEKARINLIKENKNIKEIKRQNEKQIDIENLELVIKKWIEIWCKTIVLDHLQEFKVEWEKDRQDLKIEEMMYKIKNITRKYNITIILIAHFKKVNWKPDDNSFKDSIAITQVANKVLLLHRDKLELQWITELIVSKNREKPNWTWIIEMNFDFDNLKYTNQKSKKQQKAEFNF